MTEVWILLIVAHVYGDFLLQTGAMAKNKLRPGYLAMHAGIHGLLAYLILQQWAWWPVIPAVALTHGVIDFVKTRYGTGSKAFAADQLAHLSVLALLAWIGTAVWSAEVAAMEGIALRREILIGAGFVTAVLGVGFFIGAVARELCDANPNLEEELGRGLKNGGATIGKLERALIFVFVAIGQPAGIGFLIAAKSILRFEEAKKQPLAEYVLIGTLWSFGLALAIGSLTFHLAG